MNKAEELKRKITHGLYLSVNKDVADDILVKMDEYAQLYADEQSREKIIEFFKWCMDKDEYVLIGKQPDINVEYTVSELFDQWKSKEGE